MENAEYKMQNPVSGSSGELIFHFSFFIHSYRLLRLLAVLFCMLLLHGCGPKVALPQYDEFVKTKQGSVPKTLLEIYGTYSATVDERTFSSRFNLLLEPGKRAYLEILDTSKTLLYAVSVDQNQVSLLWAQDNQYLTEKATAQNLNAVAGLPVMPDDLLLLLAGSGLNFSAWQVKEARKNGWDLVRESFSSRLIMKNDVSKIDLISNFSPALHVTYQNYRMLNNRSLPTRILFEIPIRNLKLKLEIEKYVPRDEQGTNDLFDIRVTEDVQQIKLFDVYHGKPLILLEPEQKEEETEEPQTQTQPLPQTQTQPQTQPD